MKRRALVLLVMAVLALVAAGGCSETDEEAVANTIRDYYSAYNARDWDACLGHLAAGEGAGAERTQALLEAARAITGEVTVESVANVKITGDIATADVRTSNGGESKTEECPMVKKDGHWKIDWHWY